MNSNKETTGILKDVKVNVQWKISALWVATLFLYIYADYFVLLQPGLIGQIAAGELSNGFKITKELLFGSAILMTIPSVMIFMSLALKAKVNRWANIILGVVYSIVNIWNVLSFKEPWAYIIFFNAVETVLTLLIVRYAWKWPKQEANV
jgi:hypothetical protein